MQLLRWFLEDFFNTLLPSQAQPHIRGEKHSFEAADAVAEGSTPHAQGKDFLTRHNTCEMPEMLLLSRVG